MMPPWSARSSSRRRLRWWPSTLWQTTTLEIERDGERLMVDPGIAPWEVRGAAAGRPVDHVLITHADWDHVLGIPLLPEATVHAGPSAAERIASGEAWESVVKQAAAFCIPLDGLGPLRVDDVLEPPCDATFGAGRRPCVATPGHTPDCITTLLPEERLLIAGDYLSPLEIPFAYDSVSAYRSTLETLAGLIDDHRPEWVVIGHGAPLDADAARTIAEAGHGLPGRRARLRRGRRRPGAAGRGRPSAARRRRGRRRAPQQRARRVPGGGSGMTLDDEQLRSLAEDAVEHMEPPAGEQRMADDRLIATFGSGSDPQMNVVSRLRLGSSDVDAAVDEVRAWYRRLGRDACTWEVTTASTPGDLHERLLALGMRPHDEPHMLALACTEKPDSDTPGVTVETVRTEDQLALVSSIFREDDGFDPPEDWLRATPRWLARVDGEAVATADITEMDTAVFLGGAVTVPGRAGGAPTGRWSPRAGTRRCGSASPCWSPSPSRCRSRS